MPTDLRLAGIELYFNDLQTARHFYEEVLGLRLTQQGSKRFAQFDVGNGFLCLERKGAENYPSQDKAVLFLTADLNSAIERVGRQRILRCDMNTSPPWAVLHDPEGHNILLLEKK